jgi:hypothetical protein
MDSRQWLISEGICFQYTAVSFCTAYKTDIMALSFYKVWGTTIFYITYTGILKGENSYFDSMVSGGTEYSFHHLTCSQIMK